VPKKPEPKKRRGQPLLGRERRQQLTVRVEPALRAHAETKWKNASEAFNQLLRRDLERSERRSANKLADIHTDA